MEIQPPTVHCKGPYFLIYSDADNRLWLRKISCLKSIRRKSRSWVHGRYTVFTRMGSLPGSVQLNSLALKSHLTLSTHDTSEENGNVGWILKGIDGIASDEWSWNSYNG